MLSGLGKAILPLMDFVGGQLYKYGGYYAVYGTSLTFTVVGLVYIILIPESVTRRSANPCPMSLKPFTGCPVTLIPLLCCNQFGEFPQLVGRYCS